LRAAKKGPTLAGKYIGADAASSRSYAAELFY